MTAGISAQANMSKEPKAPWTGAFEDTVGYDILQQSDGLWVIRLELGEKHLNQYGIAHGGVPLTLLDVAGGSAVYQLGSAHQPDCHYFHEYEFHPGSNARTPHRHWRD